MHQIRCKCMLWVCFFWEQYWVKYNYKCIHINVVFFICYFSFVSHIYTIKHKLKTVCFSRKKIGNSERNSSKCKMKMILHVISMHKVHAPSVACEKRFLRRKNPIYLRQKVQKYTLLSKQWIFSMIYMRWGSIHKLYWSTILVL